MWCFGFLTHSLHTYASVAMVNANANAVVNMLPLLPVLLLLRPLLRTLLRTLPYPTAVHLYIMYCAVAKARFGAYDGRGNYVVRNADEVSAGFKALGGTDL